ncbi:protein lava lamp [Drosophila albomicans]|uniref:Protein lava lamp n=1 Tax=Drosophila albomicans TaxID=7291 RepID=A0A6P8XYG5_DROAB|nr:protein lava lamp [Drosophila albomicans]
METEADLSRQHEDADDGGSFTELPINQHTTTTTATGGKARLESLRENLSKQQERLMALRERALRKAEDGGRLKSSMSDSMESLKSLGHKLSLGPVADTTLNDEPQQMSTPLVTPSKELLDLSGGSGNEKLQMLNQRTEQNRALLEQRKRDMARSLQSVKSGLRQSNSGVELGSSMNDLRALSSQHATPVSRHRSAADLQQQLQQQQQHQQQLQLQQTATTAQSEEGRLKLLKNKMKLIELKQTRKEQEQQQELHELRNALQQREQQVQQLEATLAEQSEQLIGLATTSRVQTELQQLRERNAELEQSSEMLEATQRELQQAREQLLLLEQQHEQLQQQQQESNNSTDAQVNQELAKQLQQLEQQLRDTQQQQQQQEVATNSSTSNEETQQHLSELEATIALQTEQLAEKTTELNVLNVNLRVLEEKLSQGVKAKPIFLDEVEDVQVNEQLQLELQQLKQKLDESNKSNIKLKLKCKQAEKQLQKLQSSDTQQQLTQLSAENEQLQQRITVLEDEKGQWQLAHVEEEDQEQEHDEEQQSSRVQANAAQAEAIRLLEEQKEELQQALEALQRGSESARVESELSEVQLEEQLSQRVQQLETEAKEQRQQLQTLQTEKEALDKKLSHYINENMELLDKLEKLSSSSSAESIEIVERPSERRFSQRPASEGDAGDAETEAEVEADAEAAPSFVSELTQTDSTAPDPEVNESLLQMRAESDELLKKIELFANERREVLAKMEQLQQENARLQEALEELKQQQPEQAEQHEQLQAENARLHAELQEQRDSEQSSELAAQLKHTQEQLQTERAALHSQLEELQRDKQHLSLQLQSEKSNLSQELSSMQRSSEVVAALDCGDAGVALLDKCERSLGKLSSELEAYRKANDRNAKLNVSKKLAKEAKNVHTQLTELLHKVKEASTAVETVTVVETVVAVTAPNGKALAEYEQLTAQNAELKSTLAALQAELEELRDSYEPTETTPPKTLAITEQRNAEREQELEQQLQQLSEQQTQQQLAAAEELAAVRDQLQATITEVRAAEAEHLELIARQSAELVQLQLQAEQHDNQLNASEMQHEKQLEQQQRQRHELDSRIETLEGELGILQALVAEQKQQLIESYSDRELESNLKLLELQQCQRELETSETRNRELRDKLKKYALQLKKRNVEHSDLEQQLQQLQAQQAAESETSVQLTQLQQRNAEQTQLQQQTEQRLQLVEQRLKESEQQRQEQAEEELGLQEELKRLEQQLADSESENYELQQQAHKHKSKLSKLKEETDRLQVELQNTVHANTALRQESFQLEQTLAERAGDGDNNSRTIDELRRQLEQKSIKFDKSKEVIKHRNASIQSLQRELAELRAQLQTQPEEEAQQQQQQQQLQQLQAAQEQQLQTLQQLQTENSALLAEKANFELVIARLETLHEGIQAKLQQDQSYMETLETQNTELQQRNAELQDQTTALRTEQAAELARIEQLEQQLEERSAQQLAHESQLQLRVQQLQEHEQAQSRQLQQLGSEADEVREQLASLQAEHEALLTRHKQQTQQAQAERAERQSNVEQELHELREELQQRQLELQRQRNVYDAKLAAKATELDEMECDLSAHMERATVETRELTQRLERTQEQLQQRGEELTRLGEELADVERERATLSREATLLRLQQDSAEQDVLELQELRMQALQDKTEMDNLRTQIDALCANHNQELQALQQQLAELDTLGQNQTDDQVYIETENKRLAEQLTEMQARLDEQAEQLARQQANTPAAAAVASPIFATQYQTQAQATPQGGEDWMTAWMRPNSGNQAQRQPAPAEQNLPIPAPAMFFGNDAAAAPSPFDEIVAQPLRLSSQGMGVPHDPTIAEPPTIEDLQRNVSDLEKHAKELETKLLARNQALAEHEERRQQLERLLAEREQELTQLRAATEERERLAAIEKLIQAEPQPPVQPTIVATSAAPTLDMFFGTETVTDASQQLDLGLPQTEPVVEEIITPKKAYLCQPEPEQQQQQVVVDWGVDEDPWASAAADEQHQRPAVEVLQLQQRIDELEQQKLELQTKTAKLMKRIKEYRSKEQQQQQQQEQAKSSSIGTNDLDSAIMDELRHQLQLHETRQAKSEELLQQHALEKEKLAKRIDVLTAGNERMAELKERQDMDVQMYQARIRELQEKLQQLESWGDEGTTTTTTTTGATTTTDAAPTTAAAQASIELLQVENQELSTECQELHAQLQLEKQQAHEALTQAQREREQLQQEKQRALEALAQQSELERQQLHEQLLADQQRAQAAQQEREQLQLQLEELKAKQLELPATVSAPSDESVALLQEKESEIVHLKQRIEELMREDQTEKLVLEILTKNQELQLLRMQIKQLEEDKLERPSGEELKQVTPPPSNEVELEQVRQQCVQLQQEKSDMEEELRVLNNHVLSSLELEDKMKQTVLELDMKTIEITELRKTLELLQQSQSQSQSQPQPDLTALNQQWEALVEQKCSEVANIWQEHLAQREAAYQAQIEQLTTSQQQQQQQPAEIKSAVEEQQQQPSSAPAEDNELLAKMQKALETQEMEIVTLKEQLAIRSAEYARLASQYDPFRLQNTLGGASGGAAAGAGATGSISQEPLPEYVLKADLDYALMMLHQRDMRVEEMILELVQLLEERDHLQLKLSDTLRQLEAERTGVPAAVQLAPAPQTDSDPSSDLKQKLAELQTVKHSKDKVIVDEREQRLRQMIQLQRDMAKTTTAATTTGTTSTTTTTATGTVIPPASAPPTIPQQQQQHQQQQQAQLEVDPSQSSLRSPSMVLMDWILGNNKSEDEAHPNTASSN